MSDETNPAQPETIPPPAETPPEVPETVEAIPGHSDGCSGTHPEGLSCHAARTLREAKPGDSVMVKNPAAAIEYIQAGYAPPHVKVYDHDGVEHWPLPPKAVEVEGDTGPSSQARGQTKPPAIVGEPVAIAYVAPPVNTPPHQSVEAKPRGKPPAQ